MQLSAKVYDTETSTEILKYEHARVRTGVGRLSATTDILQDQLEHEYWRLTANNIWKKDESALLER